MVEAEALNPPTPVELQPLNDLVLIKVDIKPSIIETTEPQFSPSGRIVAVGRGVFIPGVGFVPPQVAVGDHVAFSLLEGQPMNVPLNVDPKEFYVVISESLLIGKLTGATPESAWFARKGAAREAPSGLVFSGR